MQTEKKVRKVTKRTTKKVIQESDINKDVDVSNNSFSSNNLLKEHTQEEEQKEHIQQKDTQEQQQEEVENKVEDYDKQEQEQKIPKKRGRKPKGGKIIKQTVTNDNLPQAKQNIILHLKCSLNDIKDKIFPLDEETYNPVITESIDGYAFNSSKEILAFDYIKQQTDNINADDVVYFQKTKDVQNINTPVVIQNTENDSVKDIWKKLSELEHCLHNNDISDKKSACFWCTCDFDNPPIFIPKYELNNTYHVYGCFCSPECAAAYLMKENIDQASKIERYALLNHIYCKIYSYEKNIKPAPTPFYTLNKYYGNLTIQEYRKLLKNERLLLIVDKPLTRQLPELHQDNDDFIINSNSIPSASKYKIKRNSKQSKSSIVSENFGIK